MTDLNSFRFFKHCWTDEEVKLASGSPDSRVVVHPLKLNSSYAALKVMRLLSHYRIFFKLSSLFRFFMYLLRCLP